MKNSVDDAAAAPLAAFFSGALSAGLTKAHNCIVKKGNARIAPPMSETIMWAVKFPIMVVFMSSYEMSCTHSLSPAPMSSESLHHALKLKKFSFRGPKRTVLNNQSF